MCGTGFGVIEPRIGADPARVARTRDGKVAGMQRDSSTGWAGWVAFAAFMMIMIGGFHAIQGLAAILKDNFYTVTPNYVFKFDVTTWGWIHLLAGILVILAGFGLFSGATWARTVGVILAFVSAIANFAWLPYSPVWSAIMITVDVLVIYALIVHGRELNA